MTLHGPNGFNIPNDLHTLRQLNLSSPVSGVFSPSSATKPLEICGSSSQKPTSPPNLTSETADCVSARSRSSCSASSVRSYSTSATPAHGDNEEAPVTNPLTRPSRSESRCGQFAPVSFVSDRSDSDSASALSRSSSNVFTSSPSSSTFHSTSTRRRSLGGPLPFMPLPPPSSADYRRNGPTDCLLSYSVHRHAPSVSLPEFHRDRRRPRSSVPSISRPSKSRLSETLRILYVLPSDKPKDLPVPLIEKGPKSISTSLADANERLIRIRDNAAAGYRLCDEVPPSPSQVEPPSSVRRSDFGDDQISNTPPFPVDSASREFGPAVRLQLAQLTVISPEIVSKSDLPRKALRWNTRH